MTHDDERRERPQLPLGPTPPRQPEYRPTIRRDPDVEAAMVSANAMLQMKEDLAAFRVEVETLRMDRDRWQSRAEAKQELLTQTHEEMLRYKSFCDAFTARFGDVSVLLVKLIEDAQTAARDFASSDSVQRGSQTEPAIDEGHLVENLHDNTK